jgi:uncharacterized RDD family membrane protein YckC
VKNQNNILEKRFFAYIIDYLIISLISVIVMFTIWITFFSQLVKLGICINEDQVTPFVFINVITFPIVQIESLISLLPWYDGAGSVINYRTLFELRYLFWIIVFISISFLYFLLTSLFKNASIGQIKKGLKICDKSHNPPKIIIKIQRAIVKSLLPFLLFLPCIAIFTKGNKTVYDSIFGSVVIEI